jgi:hypothetical protein
MKFKNFIPMLSFILLFCFVGCNDDDYSDDIDALKKELEETKAAVKTIQDLSNALQNQLFIDSYEKTDNGYTLKMSDGSNITITQGQKGEDGEDGTDAPTITGINETEDALEFVFSDGTTITLPRGEKYDVITFEVTSHTYAPDVELRFSEFDGDYIGYGVSYPYPEDLEINWGDGKTTASAYHQYKTAGTYTVTIKAKRICGLSFGSGNGYSNIDISKCSNIQYLNLSRCEGDIKICNSPNLIEIYGCYNIPKLDLENLPNLRCVKIGGSPMAEEFPLETLNITNCPKLEILDIPYTKLTNIDISELKNLYELTCYKSSISTIWVWEGFDSSTFDEWSVPEGVEYKVKQ